MKAVLSVDMPILGTGEIPFLLLGSDRFAVGAPFGGAMAIAAQVSRIRRDDADFAIEVILHHSVVGAVTLNLKVPAPTVAAALEAASEKIREFAAEIQEAMEMPAPFQ